MSEAQARRLAAILTDKQKQDFLLLARILSMEASVSKLK